MSRIYEPARQLGTYFVLGWENSKIPVVKVVTMKSCSQFKIIILMLSCLAPFQLAFADVGPFIKTKWGQGRDYQAACPEQNGAKTYPGCTTLAAAQILYYYQHQSTPEKDMSYGLDHKGLSGPDIQGRSLNLKLTQFNYDWDEMTLDVSGASSSKINATAEFIYHVGVSLTAQFGGGQGSSATGRQIENAFRGCWGFNKKSRRSMTIISKTAFRLNDREFDAMIKAELDAGRPVMYMAQEATTNVGHAFIIDGYRNSDGKVHVNFGWGGHGNGYYQSAKLVDPSNRSWTREPMIYLGLEPSDGYAALMAPSKATKENFSWNGTGSIISYSSGTKTGYGLTKDEARIHPSRENPMVVFQWEIDQRDGKRLEIDVEQSYQGTATITYGLWNDRSKDKTYPNVTLPFVLDPAKDKKSVEDQSYYVIAVRFNSNPKQSAAVYAECSNKAGSIGSSQDENGFLVDGLEWQGNASVISYSSGTQTGYGLDHDETAIHPQSKASVVFFQWEIDGSDGTKLVIDCDTVKTATIQYGVWSERGQDIIKREVSLPFTLDPKADNLSNADGEYYVIKVSFQSQSSTTGAVTAKTKK